MGESFIRWTSGSRAAVLSVISIVASFALFNLGPYPRLKADLDQIPFPEESISSGADLSAFLVEIGAEAREAYFVFQIWDLLNPVLIGMLTLTLVTWMVGRSTTASGRAWLLVVPLITPVGDLVENGILMAAIRAFPNETALATTLPLVGGMKFGGLGLTLLLVLVLLVPTVRRRADRSAAQE